MTKHTTDASAYPGDAWVHPDVFTRWVTFIMGEDCHAGDKLFVSLADGCLYRATEEYDFVTLVDHAKGDEVPVILDAVMKARKGWPDSEDALDFAMDRLIRSYANVLGLGRPPGESSESSMEEYIESRAALRELVQ